MNERTFASFEEIKNARIGIFGLGVSGLASYRLVQECGACPLVVNQSFVQLEGEHDFILQDHPDAKERLAQCDLIILSPGIAREHAVLNVARLRNVKIWNEIELAFRLIDQKIKNVKWLALTGTNGKTSTVSLIAKMLESAGDAFFVGGNIGTPLSVLALEIQQNVIAEVDYPKVIVLELSSFQLESMENFRPHGCAILNISASHGERYERVRDYAQAKANIVKRLGPGDLFLSLKEDHWCEKLIKPGTWRWERIDKDNLDFCDLDVSKYLPFGHHNLVNLSFAIKLALVAGINTSAIQLAINEFTGVPHRLERIFEDDDCLILNDSKSTNWASTIAALEAISMDQTWADRPIHLFLGGKCRGQHDLPDQDVVEKITQRNIKIHLFGEFGNLNKDIMKEIFPTIEIRYVKNFKDLLQGVKRAGVFLFSPAFPSFDLFKSYSERGDSFCCLVNARNV